MSNLSKLSTSITDSSYQEGLQEIIDELKTVEIDTFAMNETSHARLYGEKEMLREVINYLERCL